MIMVKRQGTGHVPEWKAEKVKGLAEFLKRPVVGIVDIEKLPSAQFQEIKKRLRGKADIVIAKKRLITRAIDATGNKGLKELEPHIRGPVGLIVSDENPFRLYRFLKENKSRTAAKEGDVAEKDIMVPAGETDLPAGPALTELKLAKIDVKLDKGKIMVTKDCTVAKKGDVITKEVANALTKLNITPMEIWLHVEAFHEDGTIYTPDVLDIDPETFIRSITDAHARAFNLAVNAGVLNRKTIEFMITTAHSKALNLAVNAEIFNRATIEQILSGYGAKGKAFLAAIQAKGYQ